MSRTIKHKNPKDCDKPTDIVLLTAILDVLTPTQVLTLANKLRQVIGLGYGTITIVVHKGIPSLIQTQESCDYRDTDLIKSI